MSTTSETFITADPQPGTNGYHSDLSTETSLIAQFKLALSIYLGWSALIWLSTVFGTASITSQGVTILLIGIGASNALFYMLARSNVLHRPPAETIALTQAVVGIAWATLFTSMSSGTAELSIGIYASIVVFALLRVGRNALNQVILFAVISYSVVTLVNALSRDSATLTMVTLIQILTFVGMMFCLSISTRQVYRWHHRLMSKMAELQTNLQNKPADNEINSVNRRYILDLLAREKGRTDRSNVPFCVCVFTLDHIVAPADNVDEQVKIRRLQTAEVAIRQELRDMDSLSPTGFHEFFGSYSDKEYVAILPQTNLHGAQRSTERVLKTVTKPHQSDSAHIKLWGGIAQYQRGESISALLARAQDALSTARGSDVSRVYSNDKNVAQGDMQEQPEIRRPATVVRLETRRR